ncbi:MAG: FkbM family methyltransferase [Pseudonocardiaceae bacterium]
MSSSSAVGYLRRDEDSPGIGIPSILARQVRELLADIQLAVAGWGVRGGAALSRVMLEYHWSLARGRDCHRWTRSIQLRVGGNAVRCVVRSRLSDMFVLRELFVHQTYRFPYAQYLDPVERVVDIGSNVGLSALYFSLWFPNAEVVCVEPDEDSVGMIYRNRAANSFDWYVECSAIGSAEGRVTLYASEWAASSSTNKSVADARRSAPNRPECRLGARQVTVPVITVDGLLDSLRWDRVDILKMDVEGAEEDVFLHGDPAWLDRVRILVLDIHHKYVRRDAIVALLGECGFQAAAEHGAHSAVFLSARVRTERAGGSDA